MTGQTQLGNCTLRVPCEEPATSPLGEEADTYAATCGHCLTCCNPIPRAGCGECAKPGLPVCPAYAPQCLAGSNYQLQLQDEFSWHAPQRQGACQLPQSVTKDLAQHPSDLRQQRGLQQLAVNIRLTGYTNLPLVNSPAEYLATLLIPLHPPQPGLWLLANAAASAAYYAEPAGLQCSGGSCGGRSTSAESSDAWSPPLAAQRVDSTAGSDVRDPGSSSLTSPRSFWELSPSSYVLSLELHLPDELAEVSPVCKPQLERRRTSKEKRGRGWVGQIRSLLGSRRVDASPQSVVEEV